MENCKFFNTLGNVIRFSYETGTKKLRIFAGFGWIRPELPRYWAEFTTMCNSIFRNTAISQRIDHEIVKNTPNAARIGHELTEIRDNSPRFVRFSLTIVIKKDPSMLRGTSSKMNIPLVKQL